MEERKSILHELYVYSEWKPEPEYLQKPDNILPENISALWRWLKFFGPKKSLIDSITVHKERQQKWHIALGDEGKVIAVLTDNILEIRTKRSEYATIAARTTVSRDAYSQWRKVVWSPDCSFVAVAYGNGIVSFFDLTASNLFNIPADCTRPGGLECTDNTHAVVDIIFLPLRVKDNKWNWEVLIVTFDGKLRGYLVSQTDGCKLHHSFRFAGGVSAVAYSAAHSLLLVAGLPRGKEPTSAVHAGVTAWRLLGDEPFYKLSVVSDQLEVQLAAERLQLYVPFLAGKNMAFIISMVISPEGSKLACLHHTGDVTIWRLPLLKLLYRWPLATQPQHDLKNPLAKEAPGKDVMTFYPADVNWWSDEELILSRFSGAVSVCHVSDLVNRLGGADAVAGAGAGGAWLQGPPRVSAAHRAAFVALECEHTTLHKPPERSTELSRVESDGDDSMYDLAKELFKSVLYAITDIETFQPRPRKITVVSRVYRLLCIKSTTPEELFSRKIESGSYSDALSLAATFHLDSDLVYQQQWRKTPVSTDAIQKYLSKVSKKIWAVHQCVDRLPETLPAARELLQFGLKLTDDEILAEINKEREEAALITDPQHITPEDLNAYTSELLRCRHVMLFYRERLGLYEAILRSEKSTYAKDEYDRLRSNSLSHTAAELAKEGRIAALTCLWPHINSVHMKLDVLEKLPETLNPLQYKHLLSSLSEDRAKSPARVDQRGLDWCRNAIFRSIWSSNWSEESTPESENASHMIVSAEHIAEWYEKRARQIESLCGLVSHALTLARLAGGSQHPSLDRLLFHLLTLDTLLYDIGLEDVSLERLERLSTLETCHCLMSMTDPTTFVSDLKQYLVPYLRRCEQLAARPDDCSHGLAEYLASLSVTDLSWILLVLQSPGELELDVRTQLELAERCLFAHEGTEQLDKACDLLDTIMKESDGSIPPAELVRRLASLERLLAACGVAWWRGVTSSLAALHAQRDHRQHAHRTLTAMARRHASNPVEKVKQSKWTARYKKNAREDKQSQQGWEKLLKDILELQANLFTCVTKQECYEIYASALLTSGDAPSIKLAATVLTCEASQRANYHLVPYNTSVTLVSDAAREYFNSASSLTDPALELAKCCLTLIKDSDAQLQEELDLIAALQILNAFDVVRLPIQVRLCSDRMSLVEDCVKLNPNMAYMASHKLLRLAQLLRIAGDDERKREGQVLKLVAEQAVMAGPGGGAAAAAAARRLAALRHRPAAALLAHIATHAAAHADRQTRRELFAAAATHCAGAAIEDILRARLALRLEGLRQLAADVDPEFADAVTTPVIEKKDLIAPTQFERKMPLFNYVLDTLQTKFASGDSKPQPAPPSELGVRVPEFYRSLYPGLVGAGEAYCRFAAPDEEERECGAHTMLEWLHVQECLEAGPWSPDVQSEVIQKCAEEAIHTDTPLAVSCLLQQPSPPPPATTDRALVCGTLYATLVHCNAPALRDEVYYTRPLRMARTTLKQHNASAEQMSLIRACLDRLSSDVETARLRQLGCSVNAALFTGDTDYRRETILRLARSTDKAQAEYGSQLAQKYQLEAVDVWAARAVAVLHDAAAVRQLAAPADTRAALDRLKAEVWDGVAGDDHAALINYFTIVRSVDDKTTISGLTPADHVRLLKKAKAASHELDYKLLVSQPTAEEFSSHLLRILKPETIGLVGKLLRSLPPALAPPLPLSDIYTRWLTNYFFSVSPASATNKKWMQQYRQCSSYFNKLGKDELRQFVRETCFSDEAVTRVPAGTRNLMIMQAVDYCQQEQENEIRTNKNEVAWAQVGQELSRWARFLDNFHSDAVRALLEANHPADPVWTEIEKSHGDRSALVSPLAQLLLSDRRTAALTSLLQCLHVDAECLAAACDRCLDSVQDVQALVSRITHFHKEGIQFPEPLLERVMERASALGLPPHKQIALLSLSDKEQIRDDGDLRKLALFTLDTLRAEWAGCEDVEALTEGVLVEETSRRETLLRFVERADSWQRKKALVDILNCWPYVHNHGEPMSLHCRYVEMLLRSEDQKESLVLVKLLLRKPVLSEEDIQWLSEQIQDHAVINLMWIILMSKCEHSKDRIPNLLLKHKDALKDVKIEDDLAEALLESGLFTKLVSTPLYSGIVNYVLSKESSSDEPANLYNVKWACSELLKASFRAEAGHLQLLAIGVPSPLRGFSQSVLYYKNKFI